MCENVYSCTEILVECGMEHFLNLSHEAYDLAHESVNHH